jgi:Flp pilus assembly pilin Flp
MEMKQLALRLWREEAGQDLTEYALLMVLIALSSIVAMNGLAQAISNVYGNAASNLSSAT